MNNRLTLTCIFLCLVLVCIYVPVSAQLTANFSESTSRGCSPLTIQFRDLSVGNPTSWFWDFGNNTTSNLQNPTVVYTDSGKYTVRLIVRNAAGAAYEEKQDYVTVFQTTVPQFTSVGDSGCAPLKVTFINTSVLSDGQSWLWNFGDGSTDSSANPTHIFANGVYSVSLTAKTAQGCTDSSTMPGAVRAGNHPKADFTVSPLSGCASELRYFTNTSSGNPTSFNWNFGDGGSSFEKDPLHHYQDTGWFSVKLVTADNGCKDSIIKKQLLHVDGPVALMRVHIYCDDRFSVKFVDESIDAKNRKWNFGDGSSSTLRTNTHVYASAGVYTTRLKVDDGVCADTSTYVINAGFQKPLIKIIPQKDLYCKGDSILFVFTNYDTVFAKSFGWDFGDDSATGIGPRWDSATYVYLNKGTYNVVGYFGDNENCIDTISLNSPVIIGGPTADFSFSKPGCKDIPINFEDRSVANNGSAITSWVWNFDDGTVKNSVNTVYTYGFPLAYNVNLLVEDANGCSDSIYHEVTVASMPVVDAKPDTLLCSGQSITLHAAGASNYLWTNTIGLNCTNCSDPVATPLQTSTYYVTGSNSAGCSSQDSVFVIVQQKEKVSVNTPSVSLCAGDSIQLEANGANSYLWTPDTRLTNSGSANPTAFPTANTTFMVIGKDEHSCFSDTAMLNVIVRPKPFVNIEDKIVQLLSGSNYQIRATASEDVQRWQWLPVNGLSCSNCAAPVTTVKDNITYTVSVSNAIGCSSEDSITIISLCTQQVLYMPNTFSPNYDGMNDYFFPQSNKDVIIKSFRIYNRWGQAIFEKKNFPANNYTYGWDGKFKNAEQKSDVYVYLMEVECSNGNTVIKKGDVSLIR